MENVTKKSLLSQIKALIAYGAEDPTIHPDLLQYLEIQDLENIQAKLLAKKNQLSDEDKAWLEQFKKYD